MNYYDIKTSMFMNYIDYLNKIDLSLHPWPTWPTVGLPKANPIDLIKNRAKLKIVELCYILTNSTGVRCIKNSKAKEAPGTTL